MVSFFNRPPTPSKRPFNLPKGLVFRVRIRNLGIQEYRVEQKLREGGNGQILLARHVDTNKAICIKAPKYHGESSSELDIEREVLRDIEHPNIINLLGTQIDKANNRLLFFEYLYPNPLLFLNGTKQRQQVVWAKPPGARYIPLPFCLAADLSFELLLAIEHYHSLGLVHHDIKLGNFLIRLNCSDTEVQGDRYFNDLIQGNYRGVLIDAGSTRNLEYLEVMNSGARQSLTHTALTPALAPPELLFDVRHSNDYVGRMYSPSTDLYQAALVIYVLFTGHIPYSHLGAETQTPIPKIMDWKRLESRRQACPFDFETIQAVNFESDTEVPAWKEGPARDDFNQAFFQLLCRRIDPDIEVRGTAQQFRYEFQQLLGMRNRQIIQRRASTTANILKSNQSHRTTYAQTLGALKDVHRLSNFQKRKTREKKGRRFSRATRRINAADLKERLSE